MKKQIIILSVLLLIGHLATESYQLLWRMKPESEDIIVDSYFIDSNAKPGVNILWFIKEVIAEPLLLCIIFFVMAKIAIKISRKLFLISCVFFAYHFIDMFMLMYNFGATRWFYLVMLGLDAVALVFIIYPFREKQSQYKSME